MEKEFIPYQQALALKELEFDEPCLAFYWITGKFYITAEYHNYVGFHKQNQLGDYNYDSTSAPTFSQAFRWFREKHKLNTWVTNYYDEEFHSNVVQMIHPKTLGVDSLRFNSGFTTYEEAELECLKKLIEIVKEK